MTTARTICIYPSYSLAITAICVNLALIPRN